MNTRLIALKNIPGTVSIAAGQEFIEQNPEQARYWIDAGFARRFNLEFEAPSVSVAVTEPAPEPKRRLVNSRNWDGLFWDGMTVVAMASGESFTEEQAAKVKEWRNASTPTPTNRRTAVVNTSFRRAPWADILYACDGRWWETQDPETGMTYYTEARQSFLNEQLWTQDAPVALKYGLRLVRSDKQRGLSTKAGVVNQGYSGGFQLVNLLFQAGVAKIILLGFDCKGGHWHGEHPAGLVNRSPFKTWIHEFQYIARDLKREGVEVLNASPDSALPWFTKTTLEEALS